MPPAQTQSNGRVASLHLHPQRRSGEAMRSARSITLVEHKGIAEDERFFDRPKKTGKPSRRQVTLIEREQIAEHAASLGLSAIAPGLVRANIETAGVSLIDWIGREIEIGTAILFIAEARTPCAKMDAVAPGLRKLMGRNRQGVLAQVIRSGVIREGDVVRLRSIRMAPPPQSART